MEQFYQDNRTYDGAGLDDCGAAEARQRDQLRLQLPLRRARPTSATANGKPPAAVIGFTFTINEQNVRQTTATKAGWDARRDAGELLRHEERLLLMSRAAQSGISLIEVMVAVAIIGVLMALGMPAYSTWIQNTQIRTAAEAILNGLQTARNEAIRETPPCSSSSTTARPPQWRVNLTSDPDGEPAAAAAWPRKARPTRRSRSRRAARTR